MEHAPLAQLIQSLELGTKLHISIYFLSQYGNRKTFLPYHHRVHETPVCMAVKQTKQGLTSCYRCRNIVQKKVLRSRKPIAGYCTNGVYEYCKPVIRENSVIGVIYVGNVLTSDPAQQQKLLRHVDSTLLQTMENRCTEEMCAQVADILESYILFLFDHYGIDNQVYDPLIENIKHHILENLPFELSMADMAATFNYTEKYLGQIFKQRTGQTIKQYRNFQQIHRARKLLAGTNLSIADIALQSGFNSTTYFDRVFFKFSGLTPLGYRNAILSQNKKPKT